MWQRQEVQEVPWRLAIFQQRLADRLRRVLRPAQQSVKDPFDHPLRQVASLDEQSIIGPGALPGQEGVRFVAEGHPQTPGEGASPLCTPHSSEAR